MGFLQYLERHKQVCFECGFTGTVEITGSHIVGKWFSGWWNCPSCNTTSLLVTKKGTDIVAQAYPRFRKRPLAEIGEPWTRRFRECEAARAAGPTARAMTVRATTEALLRHLGYEGRDLGKLQRAAAPELGKHLNSSLEWIRQLGNAATHEPAFEATDEDAGTAVDLLEYLYKTLLHRPASLAAPIQKLNERLRGSGRRPIEE